MENPQPLETAPDTPADIAVPAPYGLAAPPDTAPPALPHSHAAPPDFSALALPDFAAPDSTAPDSVAPAPPDSPAPYIPAPLPAPWEDALPVPPAPAEGAPWGVRRGEIVPLSARETAANAVARTARRALPDTDDGYVEMVASGLGVAPERIAARLWEGIG